MFGRISRTSPEYKTGHAKDTTIPTSAEPRQHTTRESMMQTTQLPNHEGQTIILRHGDSFVILATIPDGTLAALISDPPYGLEFMGKSWDKLWDTGAGMTQPGIGDRAIPRPSYGQNHTPFEGLNPTCEACGGRMRGAEKCKCSEPQWEADGKKWDINGKLLSPGTIGAGFTSGGSDRFSKSQLPSFTGSTPNWICSNCGGTMRGGVRKGFYPCECGEPDFQGADEYNAGKMQQMQKWHAGWLKEVFRCLKPGGIAKVFAATRTQHRLAAAMESAGFVLEPKHSIEAWCYGCLSDDTEILTKEGWVHYHKAKVGTEVLGFDLQTGSFTWQEVEETFEYPYDDNAFRVYGDGTDQLVSIGHRCVIENDGHWDFRISQEVPATIVVPVPDGMSVMPQDVHAKDCEAATSVARVTANVERIHYHGVVWCVRVPTGAFVARRKGMAFVTGNSGFPKSLNVSKAIDSFLGHADEREVIGIARGVGGENMNDIVAGRDVIRTTDDPGGKGVGAYGTGAKQVAIDISVTMGATEEAKQFDGWGTALKPAYESFIVGRKPQANT